MGTSALRERSAHSRLAPGERLLAYGFVVSAKGVGVGAVVANRLVNSVCAQAGEAGGIAAHALLLRVTDQRVGLVRSLDGTPVREGQRAWVTRVERRPRTELMARFRLHFADGSWPSPCSYLKRLSSKGSP
ncbi:hypothetical protein [Streptomyces sp. 900105245]